MVLAAIQISVALSVGTFLFKMDWGTNLRTVILVLVAAAVFGGLAVRRFRYE